MKNPARYHVDEPTRLDALRSEWRGREGALAVASPANNEAWDAAQLEQGLLTAPVNAKAWKLTANENDALAAGCMTNLCKGIATGIMQE